MSDIKRFKLSDGREATFIVSSRSTRNGFAHDCELFVDNCHEAKATRHYLNRTWEAYYGQSVMKDCVRNVISVIEEGLLFTFKRERDIQRMTKKYKLEFEAVVAEDAEINKYKELLSMVERG